MALKTAPTSIGFERITLSAVNAVAVSSSPFTFKQQVVKHTGQVWKASVTIPPVRRELAEPWVSFLLSLQGPVHTFLLGDPNGAVPRGTSTDGDIVATGTAGASSVTLTVSNSATLKAGDYIQLGTNATAKLHKVLADISATGAVEIWPNLKSNYTNVALYCHNAKGVFRLASNIQEWEIGNSSTYGISFEAGEVIL
tara:strand:+ start:19851 stop:20441 length:591 start_codon:yes stop_codon:yes gene_type:complete